MQAIIYKPVKSASQYGRTSSKKWFLKYFPRKKFKEEIMGWIGSEQVLGQLVLSFRTLKEATNYAQKNNISYILHHPKKVVMKNKSYSDNFTD